MQAQALCSVRSQSAGCPTSPPIDFLVPGLEGHHFVAWGVDNGLVDVGFFQVHFPLFETPHNNSHCIFSQISFPVLVTYKHRSPKKAMKNPLPPPSHQYPAAGAI